MSTNTKKFDDLSAINESRRDWKIKVKVVRFWRGSTKQGQAFNNFNLILIDKQETRIQAFVPAKCNEHLQDKLALRTTCTITHFDVEKYKDDEKFRTVLNEYRLIFGEDTKVKLLDEKESKLPDDTFDFYDHSDLRGLANVNKYLTDVVGIICNRSEIKLTQVVNRLQQQQTQLKFQITDGRSNINVTFWDSMAKKLFEELQKPLDEPVMVIFASAKIGLWKEEVDLSHVAATHFYLNHKHHSVKNIRKRLQDPVFSQQITTGIKQKEIRELNIAQIKELQPQTKELEVISHVVIKYVDDKTTWFFRLCTNCKNEVVQESGNYICKLCKRIIPHPEKRFKVSIVAADSTGGIELLLKDRQVRTLIGKRAQEIYDKVFQLNFICLKSLHIGICQLNNNKNINVILCSKKKKQAFPLELKNLQTKQITVQITINKENMFSKGTTYTPTTISLGFGYFQKEKETSKEELTAKDNTETSTSTYHLDGMSQLKVDSASM